MNSSTPHPRAPGPFSACFLSAARFWEFRRVLYNLVLFAVTVIWVVATWPHFRPAFTVATLLPLFALALLANLGYSTVYLVELPLLRSTAQASWVRWRWALWVGGTLLAIVFENYWIADEIFPFVR
ncbi:MAG TPA: hypothetical protein VJX70_13360 [Candidatus Acidoferrum sp.]|nr:hypothetical protein [Candidatus Acidoferrum sp.]